MKNYTRKSDNYAGKNSYYQAKLSIAVDALDMHEIRFLTGKLDYFVNRAIECSAKLDLDMANESI